MDHASFEAGAFSIEVLLLVKTILLEGLGLLEVLGDNHAVAKVVVATWLLQ